MVERQSREHFELQRILKGKIPDKLLAYQLTLTDNLYKRVFNLCGLSFTWQTIKLKSTFIAKLTRVYLYDLLPENPAEKDIEQRILEIEILLSLVDKKADFDKFFEKKYRIKPDNLSKEYNQTFTPRRTAFDDKLMMALNYNPKKDTRRPK